MSEEFEKERSMGDYWRESTVEEEIESVDSEQIRVAYFLLARAIELLLKATILEIDSNALKNNKSLKIKDGGHNLSKMIFDAGIVLSKSDEENLKLLSHYPFIGTYPVPVKLKYMIERRELIESLDKRLTDNNYDEVAGLYDKVLARYNELRQNKGKRIKGNYLKITKPNYYKKT
jgi:hypothetical protein